MEISGILYVLLLLLTATVVCVLLFTKLGLGSVVGFIIAGILIGPNTPGPVAAQNVTELQHVSELGVVLFMFTVGLEMRPTHLWSIRKQVFGLGVAQILLSAAAIGAVAHFFAGISVRTSIVIGLGLAMSSTAVVMTILSEKGELATRHGKQSFAVLIAQDIGIVAIMAMIPLLSQMPSNEVEEPFWLVAMQVAGILGFITALGWYALPWLLGKTIKYRNKEAFGLVVLLSVIASAWAVSLVEISMTLGAFLLGILLSASDYRYQIESIVEPYKGTLMGLFFIAVGMSVDLTTLVQDWQEVVRLTVVILVSKVCVLLLLCRAFGSDWPASIRTAFYLSQAGELAFVLFSAASGTGLVNERGLKLGFLVISITMMLTPLLFKLGEYIANRFETSEGPEMPDYGAELNNHLVIAGMNDEGAIIALMAEHCEIPYIAFDENYDQVQKGKAAGRNVYFGDIEAAAVQHAAHLARANALFVSIDEQQKQRATAISLQKLFPNLSVFVRVSTFKEEEYLRSKGVKHAGTVFVESTLFRGDELLKSLGVPEERTAQLIESLRKDDYQLIRDHLIARTD